MAVRYGYMWGWAVLVLTALKGSGTILRPFLVAPEQVAFLPPRLAGFYWFPSQDLLRAAYHQSPAFPSGHALVATAVGLYLTTHTASSGGRCLLGSGIVLIPKNDFENQKQLIDEIVARSHVKVADNFQVSLPPAAELPGLPGGGMGEAPAPAPADAKTKPEGAATDKSDAKAPKR